MEIQSTFVSNESDFMKENLADENLKLQIARRAGHTEEPILRSLRFKEQQAFSTLEFDGIVGSSGPLMEVLDLVRMVAPTDSTVLIEGETGTGKELIARAVHKRSRRSGRVFVSVNCAALPPTLISSELFGHERGAFTGAIQRQLGRFELADGGTIFLDEVGELSAEMQVALLRVLQEKEFERVGGTQSIRVDVRVIAATNRNLGAAVANGTFRPDLFYRLNVFPIEAPSLRERKEDILVLVEHFVRRYATNAGKHIAAIDKRTLDLLQSYDWPGNIRELQNVIERAVILGSDDVFSVDESWLSKDALPTTSRTIQSGAKSTTLKEVDRALILQALEAAGGMIGGSEGAAAKLGLKRTTLIYKMKRLGIFRPAQGHRADRRGDDYPTPSLRVPKTSA